MASYKERYAEASAKLNLLKREMNHKNTFAQIGKEHMR